MNLGAILAIVVLLGSFTAGWTINGWRYQSKEKERVEQDLANIRSSAAATIRRADNVIAAQNAEAVRMVLLRNAAAGSRAALLGLSDAAEQALRDAASSHDACRIRADALGDVFRSCAEVLQGVAEKADRHVSDKQTLIEAFPKE